MHCEVRSISMSSWEPLVVRTVPRETEEIRGGSSFNGDSIGINGIYIYNIYMIIVIMIIAIIIVIMITIIIITIICIYIHTQNWELEIFKGI